MEVGTYILIENMWLGAGSTVCKQYKCHNAFWDFTMRKTPYSFVLLHHTVDINHKCLLCIHWNICNEPVLQPYT